MESSFQVSSDTLECFGLELVSSKLLLLQRERSAEARNLLQNSGKLLSLRALKQFSHV